MCHLGELILLISRHWKLPENLLWKQLHVHVSQCFENVRDKTEPQRWETERRALLEQDWPAKSFLRMRLLDCPTDIVRRLKNPLNTAAHGQ
jgi:siderophore synthetase component